MSLAARDLNRLERYEHTPQAGHRDFHGDQPHATKFQILAERTQIVRDKDQSDVWDLARGIRRGDWEALVSWNLSQS